MKKAKFVQDAKLDPSRYYRNPSDVVRDRRLTNQDRLEILAAWEREARERQQNEEDGANSGDELEQLQRVREEAAAGMPSPQR
jgi:Arc/MetJ-type ribon-helix-helix transcriptional regulator